MRIRPKLKIGLALLAVWGLTACDYFVRFSQTKYACQSNPLGIEKVERQKRSGSQHAIITIHRRDRPGVFVADKDGWHVTVDNLDIYYSENGKRFSALQDGKYYSLSCAQGDGFSM